MILEDIIYMLKGMEILIGLTVIGMVFRDHRFRDFEGLTSYERIKRVLPAFYPSIISQEVIMIIIACGAILGALALSGFAAILPLAVIALIPIRVRQARAIDNLRNVTFLQPM